MTVFLTYDGEGRIVQANKLYDKPTDEYLDQMNSIGRDYISIERETLVNPDACWVDGRSLAARPSMGIAVSTTTIKAGGIETAVLTGAPADCDYHVEVNVAGFGSVTTHAGKLPDGEMEMGMDMPCLFTIHIKKWPFRDFAVVIEAHG